MKEVTMILDNPPKGFEAKLVRMDYIREGQWFLNYHGHAEQSERDRYGGEWLVLTPSKPKRWVPAFGDYYDFVNGCCEVETTSYTETVSDKKRLACGNCFKPDTGRARRAAEAMRKALGDSRYAELGEKKADILEDQ